MSKITARYAGTCKACGGGFDAGAEIEWSKAGGSRHLKCPAKPAPAPAGKWTAPDKSVAPYVLRFKRGGKPGIDDQVGETFRVSAKAREHAGLAVTVVSQRRDFTSADDADDFGDCDGGGWTVTLYCRAANETETAKLVSGEEAKAAEKATLQAQADVKKAAEEAETARVTALLAPFERSEIYAFELLHGGAQEVVSSTRDGHGGSRHVSRWTLASGEVVYVRSDHHYDSDRSSLHATREVLERSWRLVHAKCPTTIAAANAWLATYSGCSGDDYYRWVASGAAEVKS